VTRSNDSWALILALVIANTMGLMPTSVTGFLVGGVIDGLGFSAIQAGVLGTSEMMAAAASSILVAPFMARISRVRIAVCGALLAASAQFASALLDSFGPLIGARLVAGVGSGLVLAAAIATAAAARNPDRVYGYAIGGYMGAISLLTPLVAALIEAMGIAAGYAALGSLYLLGLPALIHLGHAPGAAAVSRSEPLPLPRRELLLLLGIMILFGLGPGPTWAFMERLGVHIGLEVGRIGWILAVGFLCGSGGSLLAGALGARWGRTRPLVLGLLTLGAACLGFEFFSHEFVYGTMTMLFMLSYMFVQVFLLATIAAFDPSGRVGAAAAGSFVLLLGLGPVLGGLLITAGSYATLGHFAIGLCSATALLILLFGRPLDRLG